MKKNLLVLYSEKSLFNKANLMFDSGDLEKATILYQLIIDSSRNFKIIGFSMYNQSLAYLQLHKFQKSIKTLRDLLAICEGSLCESAKVLISSALIEINNLKEAEKTLKTVNSQLLDEEDYFFHKLNRARILILKGENLTARNLLRKLIEKASNNSGLNDKIKGSIHYYMGESYYTEFNNSLLKLDIQIKSIERSAELILLAQKYFIKAIGSGDYELATASLYKLGMMYSKLYKRLVSFSAPENLNAEEKAVYYEELKKELKPLIDKASYALEKNIELYSRFGIENSWIKNSKSMVKKLKNILGSKS